MTSFRNFFDQRKCEGCTDGVYKSDPNTGDYMNCPDPCPREHDDEYVADLFNKWLEDVETKLSREHYMTMGAIMELRHYEEKYTSWISFDGLKYSDIAEEFWNWIDANKKIFTANDYFEMGVRYDKR